MAVAQFLENVWKKWGGGGFLASETAQQITQPSGSATKSGKARGRGPRTQQEEIKRSVIAGFEPQKRKPFVGKQRDRNVGWVWCYRKELRVP